MMIFHQCPVDNALPVCIGWVHLLWAH